MLYARPPTAESEAHWVALVRAVAAGDQAALHGLFQRTHRIVLTLTMRIVGNRETAEELTIDVFHDVWRRASRYDAANGTVLGWIMNQARSRAIDRLRFELRAKRAAPAAGEAHVAVHGDDGFIILALKQQGEQVRGALRALSEDERQAVEAAFFAELSHAEVAARLNQPLGTVKTRIRSGLQKLRRALAPKEDE